MTNQTKQDIDDTIQHILNAVDFSPLCPYKHYLKRLRDNYVSDGDSVNIILEQNTRCYLEYIQDRWQSASRIQWLLDRIEEVEKDSH
jgi:hypothetical protein